MYSKSYRDREREREILQKDVQGNKGSVREYRPPSAGNNNGERGVWYAPRWLVLSWPDLGKLNAFWWFLMLSVGFPWKDVGLWWTSGSSKPGLVVSAWHLGIARALPVTFRHRARQKRCHKLQECDWLRVKMFEWFQGKSQFRLSYSHALDPLIREATDCYRVGEYSQGMVGAWPAWPAWPACPALNSEVLEW